MTSLVTGISLNAATTIGPGAAVNAHGFYCSAQVTVSGAVNVNPVVAFEIDPGDGNYAQVAKNSFPNGTTIFAVSNGMPFANSRANYISLGGGSTVVTAVIAVAFPS